MKVIFTDNVPGVAIKGDVRAVKNGFYRNYLQPYKKAVPATEGVLKEWEERKKQMMIMKEQLKSQLEETKRRLGTGKVKIEKKITKKGTLYGSVKTVDIASALKKDFNLEIPADCVKITKPIKALGSFEVEINLGDGVTTTIPVEVVEKA